MAGSIIIKKPLAKRIGINKPQSKAINIKPGTGGGGGGGVQFSVEDEHILVIGGKISVENNDTIVL